MTLVVVDASVVVKWFIPEVLDQEAQRLRGSEYTCIAPAHWRTEVLNALWKKLAVRHEIEAPEYEATVGFALATRMRSVPVDELLPDASRIATTYGRTIYDSLYVALALRERCPFVTADLKLFNALAPELSTTIRWLGALPADQ